MPVHARPTEDGVGLLLTCSREFTGRDLLDANDRLVAAAEQLGVYSYAIVDLAAVSSLRISADQVRQIADQDQRIAALTGPGLPVAVIAPTDVAFGISRMWEVFSQGT